MKKVQYAALAYTYITKKTKNVCNLNLKDKKI